MTADDTSQLAELATQNIIRVETALSRYPVHRLAKQGTIEIEIREESPDGEKLISWEVSHNSHYGQPGPLAYKLDTLIVNRRIEEASRPIPKVVKLGSLHEICRELEVRGGKPRDNVKKALYQNASAFIKTKLRYRGNDGSMKNLEAGFSRYSVVFTGERLPDGRKANAVYIVLNDVFLQVLDGAQTRPLDYDYLKELPPASQRLYEILSYQMYSALKGGRRYAKLSYAEFCTYAPLTRHEEWERVRSQMNKLHAPHKKSGYIASVEFEQTLDRNGRPDWIMTYAPGEKAKEEFRTFAKRGGPKTIEIQLPFPALPAKTERTRHPSPLEKELIVRGVTERTAARLVEEYPANRIEAQIEHFDWIKAKEPKNIDKSDGGFLVEAIRNSYPMPNGFKTTAERNKKLAKEKLKQEQESEEARRAYAAKLRNEELERKALARWEAMTPEERTDTEMTALAATDEKIRQSYEKSPPNFRRTFLKRICQSYLRHILEQEEAAAKQ